MKSPSFPQGRRRGGTGGGEADDGKGGGDASAGGGGGACGVAWQGGCVAGGACEGWMLLMGWKGSETLSSMAYAVDL